MYTGHKEESIYLPSAHITPGPIVGVLVKVLAFQRKVKFNITSLMTVIRDILKVITNYHKKSVIENTYMVHNFGHR